MFSSLCSSGRPQPLSGSTLVMSLYVSTSFFFLSLCPTDYVLLSLFFSSSPPPSSSTVLPNTQGIDCSCGSVGTVLYTGHTVLAFLFLFFLGIPVVPRSPSPPPPPPADFHLPLLHPLTQLSNFLSSPLVLFISFFLLLLCSLTLLNRTLLLCTPSPFLCHPLLLPLPSLPLRNAGQHSSSCWLEKGDSIPIDRGLSVGVGEWWTLCVCVCYYINTWGCVSSVQCIDY